MRKRKKLIHLEEKKNMEVVIVNFSESESGTRIIHTQHNAPSFFFLLYESLTQNEYSCNGKKMKPQRLHTRLYIYNGISSSHPYNNIF